jgi:hypothetical protein
MHCAKCGAKGPPAPTGVPLFRANPKDGSRTVWACEGCLLRPPNPEVKRIVDAVSAASDPLARCPATVSGRLPPDELSDCEFCAGTASCLDYRVPVPPELEPLPTVTCPSCHYVFSPDLGAGTCPACDGRPAVAGKCCSCGYDGEDETPCPKREDGTHCDHWWDGPDEPARAPSPSRDEGTDTKGAKP